MAEALLAGKANRLYQSWQPGLRELKPLYEETVFPAIVAFLGIHSILWPSWMQSCAAAGRPFTDEARLLRIGDPELHCYPWVCIFNPLDAYSAWVLVRGSGLPDTAKVFPDLAHNDVSLTLQMMTEERRPVIQGRAREILQGWSLVSQWHKLGELEEIFLPLLRCERLLEDWPRWLDGAAPLLQPLAEFARERVASGVDSMALRRCFLELAGELWSLLYKNKVIQCAPFDAEPWLYYLGLKKRSQRFNGILVLLGEHQLLWEQVSRNVRTGLIQ